MKKTLLATAIFSGLISATAGAATVYDADGTKLSVGGRAEVRGVFSDSVDGTMEDQSRARINILGKTKLSEKLTGFGFVEYQIDDYSDDEVSDEGIVLDGETGVENRYIYVGLSTEYGDFSYGKQVTANVQITNFSDIANYHSGINQVIDAAADNQEGVLLYSGTFGDALTVQADYQAASEDDADSYAASAVYGFDFGLDLAASYAAQDAATSADEAYQVTFGAAYTLDQLYLAVTYATGEKSETDDFDSVEVAVAYQATEQVGLIAIYGNQDVADIEIKNFFAFEANYNFNDSLSSFASYKFNEADGGEDELVLGAKYTF